MWQVLREPGLHHKQTLLIGTKQGIGDSVRLWKKCRRPVSAVAFQKYARLVIRRVAPLDEFAGVVPFRPI